MKKIELWKQADANIRMKVAGLNHFAFLIDAEDLRTGENLMSKFNERAMDYFQKHDDPWEFSALTFEVYKRFGWFPYTGDNHLGEYLQFGEEFTKTQDMINWIDRAEREGEAVYKKILRTHKKIGTGRYPKKGMLPKFPTGERAIPIIEAIVQDSNSYEVAVNIPNDGLIDNLPRDQIVEVPITVNKEGVHGVKIGKLDEGIAALLRIEASVQDVCVDAILNKSKEQAINALAIDPNVGSFEKAEAMFNEMMELQKAHLNYFK